MTFRNAKVDVNGGGGVGEGSDGNEVWTGFRVGFHGGQGDAARDFDAAISAGFDEVDFDFSLRGRHVVEENTGDAEVEGFDDFLMRADFAFNGQAGFEGLRDGGGNSACEVDVVVFDENGVPKSHAVVDGAAGLGGHLFELAEAGGGLAGIEDFSVGSGNRIDVLASEGGDAAQALQEIEGYAFMGEQEAGVPSGAGNLIVGGKGVSVVVKDLDYRKDKLEDVDAREHEVLFGVEGALGQKVWRNGVCTGDVA